MKSCFAAPNRPLARTRAFTLVELLVVVAIIGILAGMLLPAIQATREAARRMQCSNNLSQLAVAIANYEMAHQLLPPGTINATGPIVHTPVGFHHSWIVQILPMIEERVAYRSMKHNESVYSAANAAVRAHSIPSLHCPSSAVSGPFSNYAAVHHDSEAPIDVTNNGLFFLNIRVQYDDVIDGLSYTVAVGEKSVDSLDLGWGSGTRASLRNLGGGLTTGFARHSGLPPGLVMADAAGNPIDADGDGMVDDLLSESNVTNWTIPRSNPSTWVALEDLPQSNPNAPRNGTAVGGFSSAHTGGVQFALGDGSVRFLSSSIDRRMLSRLGSRADGILVDRMEW